MPKLSRNFTGGKMNKTIDERLLPEGEYIDAMNIRMGSTEKSEIGVIENTKGNTPLTSLIGPGAIQLSVNARCIGALDDSANETLYWLVHDETFSAGATGKCDMVVSYNILTNVLTYHVVSVDDGGGVNTTLNFHPEYVITGINKIGDLLFFTDYYNNPRCINVKKNYPQPVLFIDQITEEDILVIKKPPTESPLVQPSTTTGQENYMDIRFISFAYRYRYADGEYSATSQWSQVAFIPKPFEFSKNSMLNEGMTNLCNAAIITYNSGGPLVIGIDLLFKQSANNVIKVIEKLDKSNLGLSDNMDYQYTFSNSKIFTVLPESELLRLFDNVPIKAKAQTIMGNRLMYGNYIEGYDLVDSNGDSLRLEYTTELISQPIGSASVPCSKINASFSIGGISQIVTNGTVLVNLEDAQLKAGSLLSVKMTIGHASFSGDAPYPSETTNEIGIDFNYFLVNDYASVYEMATSPEFVAAVGSSLPTGNIKPVSSTTPGVETSCDGTTFTDNVNCVLPNNLDALIKQGSGISAVGQAIQIIASPTSSQIGLQMIAMRYVDNLSAPTQSVYEYYTISFAEAYFQKDGNSQSLHSNRGYEIGIVYMDEFNRASTAVVSPNNTQYVPCAYSPNKNSIQVTIPSSQHPPYWAKRYKFVIKPDAEGYETIYSNLFFSDPATNEVWFFLEGENAQKVEVGDRLIVKSDSEGPVLSCVNATVLEKAVKEAGFITPTTGVTVLGGVYMKMNPNGFNAVAGANSTVAPGEKQTYAPPGGNYTKLDYPMNIEDPNTPGTYIDYTVPAGSRISIKWDWNREGTSNKCEHRGYTYEKTFIASTDYANMEDWFNGDNVAQTLASGFSKDGTTVLNYIPTNGVLSTFGFDVCYIQFYRDPGSNQLVIQLGSGLSCTGSNANGKRYYVKSEITVFRAIDTIVFETQPTDALPDVFYENNLSFAIENGNHMGNIQNQDINIGQSAIIDTGFFNCFSFGNGAESYKIRDSIIGRYFTLGERVTTVTAQEYKAASRFADITYSGVYNQETNFNKLNEFNAGLLNYKNLETSFGPVYILDGRETDVLVLQEDKISYVLAGKNLLSDSAAGGAITSVPEVLGTQIARTEKYGISFNPESYVQWGQNRYFTDVKRGAVINLIGDSANQDQIKVISEAGMRTWFRDEFNMYFSTQKLGGFDPYMNEYVLVSNDVQTPRGGDCVACGVSQTLTLNNFNSEEYSTYEYCVTLGEYVGDTELDWEVINNSGGDFKIDVIYNGNTYTSGWTNDDTGIITFPKDVINERTVSIIVSYYSESLSIDVFQGCPPAEELTIVEVVLTNNSDTGDTTHVEYRYTNGTYVGALQSIAVTMGSAVTPPVVSRYNLVSGIVGNAGFPPAGSTMRIQSNQIAPDNFVFNPTSDKFRYFRSSVLYPNTPTGITNLINASLSISPILGGGTTYYSDFVVPPSSFGQYLYLIWDYRDSNPSILCYTESEASLTDICCDCVPCTTGCITVQLTNLIDGPSEVYFPFGNDSCGGESGSFSVELDPNEVHLVCIDNVGAQILWEVISGAVQVKVVACECGDCPQNTVPPTLSYTSLYPGSVITANPGTWINV